MKNTLFLFALLGLASLGFPQDRPAPAAAASGKDPAFARFVDDYFDARFASRPTEGTRAGFHQYDTKMPDFSRAAIDARTAELKAQLARLNAFARAKQPFEDAIDAAAHEGALRSELLDLATLRTW